MLEAKTKLSKLVEAAEHGEEVLIARDGIPVAQIVPLRKQKLNVGFLKGKVPPVPDSMLFSISDEDIDELFNLKDE